jgi:hypothetical protein
VERGLNPRPDLDEDHFYIATEAWPPSQGWREGSGQPNTNARLATYGKASGPRFIVEDYAKWSNPEKIQLKWLTNKKVVGWAFDDWRWCGAITDRGADSHSSLSGAPRFVVICREHWRDGFTTMAEGDAVRPWQRSWRLCEVHSTKERRDRARPRSRPACVACGYIQWRDHDGTNLSQVPEIVLRVYREQLRLGAALHEACWKAWTRARKQGVSWSTFAKARRIRVRARRILEEVLQCQDECDRIVQKERKQAQAIASGDLMSLRYSDCRGEISPAWRRYLMDAIGRETSM